MSISLYQGFHCGKKRGWSESEEPLGKESYHRRQVQTALRILPPDWAEKFLSITFVLLCPISEK